MKRRRPVLLRTVGSLTLVALVGFNGWLLLLNLAKHDRLPASFDRVPGVVVATADDAGDAVDAAADGDPDAQALGATDGDGAAAAFTTDASVVTDGGQPGTIQVDDWPGGRGTVPDGPPTRRRVRLMADGRLMVTGSAPTWAVVTELVEGLGRRLGRDPATIDVEVVWHPESSPQVGEGEVVLDAPLLYRPGQIDLPEGAASSLAPAVALLAEHPELYVVVVGLVDDGAAAAGGASDELSAVALGRTAVVADVFTDGGIGADRLVMSVASMDSGGDEELAGERVLVRIENLLVFGPGS